MSFFSSCIYSGFTAHKRFRPRRHFFSYKIFSLLIDLNEVESLERKIKFFSYNKFNILSFYDVDHGPRDGSCLTKWVKKILIESKINIRSGTIKLLCFPRFFGYVFNPLSIFYCYGENSQLKRTCLSRYRTKNKLAYYQACQYQQATKSHKQQLFSRFHVNLSSFLVKTDSLRRTYPSSQTSNIY